MVAVAIWLAAGGWAGAREAATTARARGWRLAAQFTQTYVDHKRHLEPTGSADPAPL